MNTINQEVTSSSFYNRENEFVHHPYEREMKKFQYLREGKEEALTEFYRTHDFSRTGRLSDDPLRNVKYLFVASTTITCRFAIEGGLAADESYNISDVFIRKADACTTVEEVRAIYPEMFTYFLRSVQRIKSKTTYSKPIVLCINYISTHLHEKLSLRILADYVALSPSYLSSLFKKEMSCTVTEYILNQKIESAKNLLCFSDYSISELANFLAFSSESRFIEVFRKKTGLSPKKYRTQNYNKNFLQKSTLP